MSMMATMQNIERHTLLKLAIFSKFFSKISHAKQKFEINKNKQVLTCIF